MAGRAARRPGRALPLCIPARIVDTLSHVQRGARVRHSSDWSLMPPSAPERSTAKILDLEVKDARIIFTPIWETLEEEVGREHLRFPKEIILLGGAPGAGKGTQTQFIN